MAGHFSSRKYRLLVSMLLLSGSVAGFGLGQQLGHSHLPPTRRVSVQSARVGGAIGGHVVTSAPPVRTHATTGSPARGRSSPSGSKPASGHKAHGKGDGNKHGHKDDGHGDGHNHGHKQKDDGHPKADHHNNHENGWSAEMSAQPGDHHSAQLHAAQDGEHAPGGR